jgi:hypothetical protein
LVLNVLQITFTSKEFSLDDHLGGSLNGLEFVSFATLSFDFNSNVVVSRHLVNGVHHFLEEGALIGLDLAFEHEVLLELGGALGEHGDVFSLNSLGDRQLRSLDNHIDLLANLELGAFIKRSPTDTILSFFFLQVFYSIVFSPLLLLRELLFIIGGPVTI